MDTYSTGEAAVCLERPIEEISQYIVCGSQ